MSEDTLLKNYKALSEDLYQLVLDLNALLDDLKQNVTIAQVQEIRKMQSRIANTILNEE